VPRRVHQDGHRPLGLGRPGDFGEDASEVGDGDGTHDLSSPTLMRLIQTSSTSGATPGAPFTSTSKTGIDWLAVADSRSAAISPRR